MTSPTVTVRPPAPADGARRVQSELLVARRYLDHGFLDAAMRIFGRRAGHVRREDWARLVERLLERGRIADAVAVCQAGDLPLPREQLLTLGDRALRRKDVDEAMHYYALAEADAVRWAALLDLLIRLPGRELQAREVAERHLLPADAAAAPALRLSA